jgi:uncharacterized protein with ATP-grasp and redox domains
MRVHPTCVPCLLGRVLYETNLVDPTKAPETMGAALDIMNEEFGRGVNSAKLATKVHKRTYEILGDMDPYADVKRRCNEEALKLYPIAEKLVLNSKDRFKASVLCSIVGNVLDFGIDSPLSNPEELPVMFEKLYAEGLGHDDTERIMEILRGAREVLYFADNAGEIVFDQLVLKELNELEVKVTLVVRGEPILTDVTMPDVKDLDLDSIVNDVTTTNAFAVGVDFDRIDGALKDKLASTDLIISKGMANWESFSDEDYSPIAHLLRTKCEPVAATVGVKKGLNVAKLFE